MNKSRAPRFNELGRLAGRYFGIWVLLGTLFGAIRPDMLIWVGPQIPLLLGVVMFGMGMTLKTGDLLITLRKPKIVMLGVIAQYTVMPLLAYGLANALRLPPELAVGLILLGSCPGGTASNIVTYLAKGDLALSVAMTSTSTLISPILTPLITLGLAGQWLSVSAEALFLSIIKIVLLPVVAGLLTYRYFTTLASKLVPLLPLVSVAAIVLIVANVVGINIDQILLTAPTLFIAVAIHNIVGIGIGYGLARLVQAGVPQRRTVAIEVGMQNSGLAVSLATTHFNPATAIPGALFSVWHNLTGPALASYWASRKKDA